MKGTEKEKNGKDYYIHQRGFAGIGKKPSPKPIGNKNNTQIKKTQDQTIHPS
jgi:hypothetical protein